MAYIDQLFSELRYFKKNYIFLGRVKFDFFEIFKNILKNIFLKYAIGTLNWQYHDEHILPSNVQIGLGGKTLHIAKVKSFLDVCLCVFSFHLNRFWRLRAICVRHGIANSGFRWHIFQKIFLKKIVKNFKKVKFDPSHLHFLF